MRPHMSALPPKADIQLASPKVRFVQKRSLPSFVERVLRNIWPGPQAAAQSFSVAQPSLSGAILTPMKVEEIAEAVAKLPPDQLARFRRWFTAFEAGRTNHAEELDSGATKLGRLAGRAFAELKKRAKEP